MRRDRAHRRAPRARGAYLRRYAYDFIKLFAPNLSRDLVEKTVMEKAGTNYEL